jgi:hypothetical protein
MRIHNPQEEKKNKGKPSKLDGQVHGGMMETADQFGNLISAAVSNIGDNQEESEKSKRS